MCCVSTQSIAKSTVCESAECSVSTQHHANKKLSAKCHVRTLHFALFFCPMVSAVCEPHSPNASHMKHLAASNSEQPEKTSRLEQTVQQQNTAQPHVMKTFFTPVVVRCGVVTRGDSGRGRPSGEALGDRNRRRDHETEFRSSQPLGQVARQARGQGKKGSRDKTPRKEGLLGCRVGLEGRVFEERTQSSPLKGNC